MDKYGEAHASIFSRGESGRLNSLSVVLSQEIDRFNRLTKQMQTSLKELQKAIKGLVVMSDELEQMLHSMLDSKVCALTTWHSRWFAPSTTFSAVILKGVPGMISSC